MCVCRCLIAYVAMGTPTLFLLQVHRGPDAVRPRHPPQQGVQYPGGGSAAGHQEVGVLDVCYGLPPAQARLSHYLFHDRQSPCGIGHSRRGGDVSLVLSPTLSFGTFVHRPTPPVPNSPTPICSLGGNDFVQERVCATCGTTSSSSARYCSRCYRALSRVSSVTKEVKHRR